jgi:Skp family chaperone for outer membrane proteins
MAKGSLPSVDDAPQAKVTAVVQVEPTIETQDTEGYLSTNMVDIKKRADTKLTRSQALELRDKMRRLQDDDQTLKDGSYIRSKSDVIRWMIERPLAPY